MANTTISPNMKLPVPTVGTDPGPDWAENINASLNAIDSHNHSSGQGVQINSDGININTDFPVNENNVTTARSVNFSAQLSPLSLPTDVGCIYVSGEDLYYNDESGNQVRITNGGSVAGSSGTITGLPSGTASASFSGSTFTFQSATSTPATISGGPIIISRGAANPKTVTISGNASQAANYAMTLPLALPGSTSISNVDSSGQQGLVAPDGTSFGVSGGTYQVLDSGVSTAKIANLAVTNGKIADAVISNSKLAALNYNRDAPPDFTTSSTSLVTTGAAATITGIGRPVMIIFTTNESGNDGFMGCTNSGVVTFAIKLNGTTIQKTNFVGISSGTPSIPAWTIVDTTGSTGSLTYELFASVSSGTATLTIRNFEIFVMEL